MSVKRPAVIRIAPRVRLALGHYVRCRALEPRPLADRYGISAAANELLELALTRKGLNPNALRLIGDSRKHCA